MSWADTRAGRWVDDLPQCRVECSKPRCGEEYSEPAEPLGGKGMRWQLTVRTPRPGSEWIGIGREQTLHQFRPVRILRELRIGFEQSRNGRAELLELYRFVRACVLALPLVLEGDEGRPAHRHVVGQPGGREQLDDLVVVVIIELDRYRQRPAEDFVDLVPRA